MTTPIRVTIHSIGDALCSLSGKEAEGITCTFEDGTVNGHLSWKSFRQLVAMKTMQNGAKPVPKPVLAMTPPATPAPAPAVPTAVAAK